jgi:cellulose synthase (UDP-forming)
MPRHGLGWVMSAEPASGPGFFAPGLPVRTAGRSGSALPFQRTLAPGLLAPILTPRQYVFHAVLILMWAVATVYFWAWWLNPAHMVGVFRFIAASIVMAWISFLELFFIFFFIRAVRSVAPDPQPGQWRVAMVVTKTPSEPFAILKKSLEAMLAQDYPHDTWICDEDPTPETEAWCAAHGVRVCSRKGIEAYHQKVWPRRTRCKEGNLAYFYDYVGYGQYDIVSQLDADHVPQPGYLREMIRPFADPAVGYVSAPSICASNADENWSARTRLFAEGGFHGIMQSGYSNGFAPMCIGSHYAVRTEALREVGGLGPELAEDHSTTMLMNAGGWRGVHAIDAIAIGDGPATVADMVTQEFQWSRSLVTVLLQYTQNYLGKLPPRLKALFLFCQLFYPFQALAYLLGYLLPVAAVTFDIKYADVTFPTYLQHAMPSVVIVLTIFWTLQAQGLLRPAKTTVLSWERILFIVVQWPWVLWGCLMALRDKLTGKFVDFRITPKGDAARGRMPARVLVVYAVLALGCILPVLLKTNLQEASGFLLISLTSGLLYTAVVVVSVWHHLSENHWRFVGTMRDGLLQGGLVVGLIATIGVAMVDRSAESLFSLSTGLEPLQIVEARSRVAGAGSSRTGLMTYRFNIRWLDTTSEPNG